MAPTVGPIGITIGCWMFSCLLVTLLASGCRPAPSASVVSYETKLPIANATILHAGETARTDARGEFVFKHLEPAQPLLVRAAGFWPKKCDLPAAKLPRLELEPLELRGLYLSYAALGMPETRARALQLLDGTRLNTLVVDIKDRQGRMTFYNGAPNAGQIGAFGAVKFDDIQNFLKQMHQKHIYVVGRIAIFRDPLYGKQNPEWTVHAGGKPNLFLPDPYRKEVRDYNLAIIKEAASVGFDELELDCVWFPAERELPNAEYSRHNSAGNRMEAIESFLAQAGEILAPRNVCLGLAPGTAARWEGQRSGKGLEPLTRSAQYLSAGVRDLRDVSLLGTGTADDARQWRAYLECGGTTPREPAARPEEIKQIVKACRAAHLSGWILSDARNQYSLSPDLIRELTPEQ
jgi:hypothetical protein